MTQITPQSRPILLITALENVLQFDDLQLASLALEILVSAEHLDSPIKSPEHLITSDPTLVAFEILLDGCKKLSQGPEVQNKVLASINEVQLSDALSHYIAKVRKLLLAWHKDPNLLQTITGLLTGIYQRQIISVEQLMRSCSSTMQQLGGFVILLHSQIVSLKNLAAQLQTQQKEIQKSLIRSAEKHNILSILANSKQQIIKILKIQEFNINKIFDKLLHLIHDEREIFKAKHRFLAEEFKIFLHTSTTVWQDPNNSAMLTANIYDILMRIQVELKQIKAGILYGRTA